MPRDLLPMPALFHPDSCEPEIFAFAGIWHPTAPNDGFSASDNHDIAVDPEILDLPIERCDNEKAGINHSQNLLLRNKLVQRVRHDEIVRLQTCHGRAIVFPKASTSSAFSRRIPSSAVSELVFATLTPNDVSKSSGRAMEAAMIFRRELCGRYPTKSSSNRYLALAKSRILLLFHLPQRVF